MRRAWGCGPLAQTARADHPSPGQPEPARQAKQQRVHPAPHPARRASLHSTPQTHFQTGRFTHPRSRNPPPGARCARATSCAMTEHLSSNVVNYLVWRYLQEAGTSLFPDARVFSPNTSPRQTMSCLDAPLPAHPARASKPSSAAPPPPRADLRIRESLAHPSILIFKRIRQSSAGAGA